MVFTYQTLKWPSLSRSPDLILLRNLSALARSFSGGKFANSRFNDFLRVPIFLCEAEYASTSNIHQIKIIIGFKSGDTGGNTSLLKSFANSRLHQSWLFLMCVMERSLVESVNAIFEMFFFHVLSRCNQKFLIQIMRMVFKHIAQYDLVKC